jgi:glycosyltransferase involved in cell wall biosynthesis
MRVLHVSHQYPPAIGGSEKYIADLSEALAARGHQVDVFTSRSTDYHTWKGELDGRARVNGVDVHRFRALRRTRLLWRVLEWSLGRYWQTRSRWYEPLILVGGGPICPAMFAAMLARGARYDLVHLNCLVYSHVSYGYRAARWRGVPVIVTPHAHAGQPVTYGLGYQLDVLRHADHVLADTAGERDLMLELGLDPGRVTTAGVGLQPDQYPERDMAECRRRLGLPEGVFVALFLGRQVEYKGLEATLDAFYALQQRFQGRRENPILVVAGPETEYSRRLFARHRATPGVINLGAVSDDTRLDVLNACDCVVLPSAGEAFGIVFLEAWIVGKPVIGPRSAAVSTVVQEGLDGWLVPPGDVSAIVEALVRWIEAPLLAWQMGEAGREKVLRHYTCARIAEIVEDVYMRTRRTFRTRSKAD